MYTPKLWYFELLEFTIVHELPKASKSFLPSASTDVNEDMEPQEEDDTEDQIFDAPESEIMGTTSTPFTTPTCSLMKRKPTQEPLMVKKPRTQKTTIETQRENLINTAITALQQNEDEYDVVGKSVAAKLRKMKEIQRIHAEKLINDVMYKGLLEQLDETTSISNDASSNYTWMTTPSGRSSCSSQQ